MNKLFDVQLLGFLKKDELYCPISPGDILFEISFDKYSFSSFSVAEYMVYGGIPICVQHFPCRMHSRTGIRAIPDFQKAELLAAPFGELYKISDDEFDFMLSAAVQSMAVDIPRISRNPLICWYRGAPQFVLAMKRAVEKIRRGISQRLNWWRKTGLLPVLDLNEYLAEFWARPGNAKFKGDRLTQNT